MVHGEDVLDAVIAGVNIVELDPEDDSVGYGGLPNADGVVQLDASLHARAEASAPAPSPRLEGVRTPSLVAKAVLRADRPPPARGQGRAGLRPRDRASRSRTTSTPRTRASSGSTGSAGSIPSTIWIPPSAAEAGDRARARDDGRGAASTPSHVYGTINCDGVNAKGEICGVTTTSGLAVEDPRPRGRLADPGRGPLRRRRRGRGRLDRPRRGQPRTTSRRTSSSRTCAAAWPRRTPGWRPSSASRPRTRSRSGSSTSRGHPMSRPEVLRSSNRQGRYAGVGHVRAAGRRTRPTPSAPTGRPGDAALRRALRGRDPE